MSTLNKHVSKQHKMLMSLSRYSLTIFHAQNWPDYLPLCIDLKKKIGFKCYRDNCKAKHRNQANGEDAVNTTRTTCLHLDETAGRTLQTNKNATKIWFHSRNTSPCEYAREHLRHIRHPSSLDPTGCTLEVRGSHASKDNQLTHKKEAISFRNRR